MAGGFFATAVSDLHPLGLEVPPRPGAPCSMREMYAQGPASSRRAACCWLCVRLLATAGAAAQPWVTLATRCCRTALNQQVKDQGTSSNACRLVRASADRCARARARRAGALHSTSSHAPQASRGVWEGEPCLLSVAEAKQGTGP